MKRSWPVALALLLIASWPVYTQDKPNLKQRLTEVELLLTESLAVTQSLSERTETLTLALREASARSEISEQKIADLEKQLSEALALRAEQEKKSAAYKSVYDVLLISFEESKRISAETTVKLEEEIWNTVAHYERRLRRTKIGLVAVGIAALAALTYGLLK